MRRKQAWHPCSRKTHARMRSSWPCRRCWKRWPRCCDVIGVSTMCAWLRCWRVLRRNSNGKGSSRHCIPCWRKKTDEDVQRHCSCEPHTIVLNCIREQRERRITFIAFLARYASFSFSAEVSDKTLGQGNGTGCDRG